MNRKHTDLAVFKMNMQMFVDEYLNRGYEPIFFGKDSDRLRLDAIMIYYGQKKLEEHVLYYCSEECFRAHPVNNQDICMVICGPETSPSISYGVSVLYFTGSDVSEIMNVGLEIQWKLTEIISRMSVAAQNCELSTLSDIGVELFNNPLTIHDEKFQVLSRPRNILGMSEIYRDQSTGITTFSLDLIHSLNRDPAYIQTLTTRGTHMWLRQPSTPYRVLYCNMFDQNQRYRGRVLLNEINAFFCLSHYTLLEYFTAHVLYVLTNTKKSQDDTYVVFDAFLRKYLEGDTPARESALKILSFNFWNPTDRYCCTCIVPRTPHPVSSTYDVVMTELLMKFPTSRVFQTDSNIWLITNLTFGKISRTDYNALLDTFAASGPYLIGQSSFSRDFFRLSSLYKQAAMAMEYGQATQELPHLFRFDEIAADYSILKIRDHISEDAFCCEQLLSLIDSDKKKGTEYFHTLKTYLENERNLPNVSQQLHIHRSTLVYRLGKIQEILELDLDSPKVRFYLQCCFRILDSQY